MSVKIKYGQEIVWGTGTAGTVAQGKVLSADRSESGQEFEQVDENGEAYAVVFYNQTEELSLEVLALPTASVPESGDVVAVGGEDWLCTGANEVWSTSDAKKIRLTLKRWKAAGALS